MTLVKRNQSWLPSIFNDIFDGEIMNQFTGNVAVNVKESEKEYTVEVAAPGMTKEDFNVRIDEENYLIVSVEKKQEKELKEGEKYIRRDFVCSNFQQALIIPDNADKEAVSAKVENGVLYVTLPKMTQEQIKKAQRCITID